MDIVIKLNGKSINKSIHYFDVTFTLFKYIDDLEVVYLIDKHKLVIRSESREGVGDFGVNLKRVDLLKSKFLGE